MRLGFDEGFRRRRGRRRRRDGFADRGRHLRIVGLSAAGLSMSPICRASLTSFCSEVMTLAGERPVATSLTSSKLFLRSAISASRMASWNWPWNSPAILRALPIHCPTMRSTPGSSFGPMAISATTAMTTSSLHPMSNMNSSARARRPRPNPYLARFGAARAFSQPASFNRRLVRDAWFRQPCCRHPSVPPSAPASHCDRWSSPARRAFRVPCHRPASPS